MCFKCSWLYNQLESPFLNLTIKACSYISQNDSRQLAVVLIQFLGSICLWLCLLIFHMLIYCIKHNMTWQNVMNPLPSVVLSAKWKRWQGGARGGAGRSGPSSRKSLAGITNVHTGLFCYQQYVCAFYFWMEGWPRTVHLLITSLPHRHLLYKDEQDGAEDGSCELRENFAVFRMFYLFFCCFTC